MFQFQVPGMQPKLDPVDDQILQGVHERKSLQEMGREVGRSFANIRDRCKILEENGYLVYNPHIARGRQLTKQAEEYMVANGLLKRELFA